MKLNYSFVAKLQGKGHAEMAVTKPKGSGAETPTSEPGYCVTDALWDAEWDDAEELFLYRHQRRLSDPSANLNNFVRGGWRTKPDSIATKARSENEGLDSMANGLSEIEAGDVKDGKRIIFFLFLILYFFIFMLPTQRFPNAFFKYVLTSFINISKYPFHSHFNP